MYNNPSNFPNHHHYGPMPLYHPHTSHWQPFPQTLHHQPQHQLQQMEQQGFWPSTSQHQASRPNPHQNSSNGGYNSSMESSPSSTYSPENNLQPAPMQMHPSQNQNHPGGLNSDSPSPGSSSANCWPDLNIKHERLELPPAANHSNFGTGGSPCSVGQRSTSQSDENSSNFPDSECLLSSPGINFDPSSRTFSHEELRPTPIVRKRRKVNIALH